MLNSFFFFCITTPSIQLHLASGTISLWVYGLVPAALACRLLYCFSEMYALAKRKKKAAPVP